MSSGAVVVNALASTYDGRFYVAQYQTLPATWADIGKVGTDYVSITSGSQSADFSKFKYLVVALMPTKGDLTGTAVAYDVSQLLNYYATSDGSLTMYFCQMSNGAFNIVGPTPGTLTPGTSKVTAGEIYVGLNSYSLTAIPNAVTGTFGYTIGDSTGSMTYGIADSTGVLQKIKLHRGVVVKIRHSMSMLMWVLVLLVLLVVIVVVGYVGYMYYKKHKGMM